MSQRRTGFVLDAKSMDISAPRSASPSRSSPSTSPTRERRAGHQQADQPSQQPPAPSSVESVIGPSTSTMFPAQNDLVRLGAMQQVAAGISLCPSNAQCNVSTDTISTDYYKCHLDRLRALSGDTARMNFELNNIFVKRLEEIDCLDKQKGDATSLTPQLRLVTYQEWVDLLLQVNYIMFINMSSLEEESYEKISACFNSVRGQQQQLLDENRKLRQDFCAIIKLVQNAYHKNSWNTQDISLETMTLNQLLGIPRDQPNMESESEKVNKCMESLVNEMAAKHDEVCHLQRQLCVLDGVVQTARQKIILKDQCIAQLNQQLADLSDRLANITQHEKFLEDFQQKEDSISQTDEQFDSGLLDGLSERDQQESDILRILCEELKELFNLNTKDKTEFMEKYRRSLHTFVEKMNSERSETLKKLEYVRDQLFSLQREEDNSIVPLASSTQRQTHQRIEDDPDSQLLESLRQRFKILNCSNKELRLKYQDLSVEYKDLQAKYNTDQRIHQRSSDILKELADLICSMRSIEFPYNDIYKESSTGNPFSKAFMEIFKQEQVNKSYKSETETSSNNTVKPPTTTVTQPPPTPTPTPRGSI